MRSIDTLTRNNRYYYIGNEVLPVNLSFSFLVLLVVDFQNKKKQYSACVSLPLSNCENILQMEPNIDVSQQEGGKKRKRLTEGEEDSPVCSETTTSTSTSESSTSALVTPVALQVSGFSSEVQDPPKLRFLTKSRMRQAIVR